MFRLEQNKRIEQKNFDPFCPLCPKMQTNTKNTNFCNKNKQQQKGI